MRCFSLDCFLTTCIITGILPPTILLIIHNVFLGGSGKVDIKRCIYDYECCQMILVYMIYPVKYHHYISYILLNTIGTNHLFC